MDDLISKQDVFDEILRFSGYLDKDMITRIYIGLNRLPVAQLKIVRCKDCEYGEQDEIGRWYCRSLGCQIGDDDGNGFCSDAERREK